MGDMSAFRLYAPEECTGKGNYPPEWHDTIKHQVREEAGHRCIRCLHPYKVGESGMYEGPSGNRDELAGELGISGRAVDLGFEMAEYEPLPERVLKTARRTNWSKCDKQCNHGGPRRYKLEGSDEWCLSDGDAPYQPSNATVIEASWRILTVHHLNERKEDCRWHNLVALCQRLPLSSSDPRACQDGADIPIRAYGMV